VQKPVYRVRVTPAIHDQICPCMSTSQAELLDSTGSAKIIGYTKLISRGRQLESSVLFVRHRSVDSGC